MNYMKLNRIMYICYISQCTYGWFYKLISTEFVRRFNYKFNSHARIGNNGTPFGLSLSRSLFSLTALLLTAKRPPKPNCLLPCHVRVTDMPDRDMTHV